MNYEQNKFTLNFEDPTVERSYKAYQDDQLEQPLRMGLIQSLIGWTIAATIFYFIDNGSHSLKSLLILSVVYPTFVPMLLLSYSNRLRGWNHFSAALSNLIAGILLVFIANKLDHVEFHLLIFLIFLIFFGMYSYHFRIVTTSVLTFVYISAYLTYLLLYSEVQSVSLSVLLFYASFVLLFVITTGHQTDKKDRWLFVLQNKLAAERERSDQLLLNILPKDIALRLKEGERTIADNYNQVTVMFADIVGFTPLAGRLKPEKLVHLLNHIFSSFDTMATNYNVEKIKTIGDAYMIVGGLNTEDSGAHDIAHLAVEMRDFFEKDPMVHQFDLQIRIGFHTGPVTAGVIGLTKFSFDLWGDTVNTASRMQSHSEPGKINLSAHSMQLLEGTYSFDARQPMEIKGKGTMQTYFLKTSVD